MCSVGLTEALVVEEVATFEGEELTATLDEDVFEVFEVKLRTLLDDVVDFTDELDLTAIEDFEVLEEDVETTLEELEIFNDVVEKMLETLELFDVDEDTRMLLLEAEVESKYISRRLPAPQYS